MNESLAPQQRSSLLLYTMVHVIRPLNSCMMRYCWRQRCRHTNTVPSTSCKALVNPRLDNQIPIQKLFPKLSKSCMVRTMSPSSGGLGGRSNTPLNSSTRGAPVTVVGEAAQSITTVAVRFADTGRGRRGLVRVNGKSGTYFSI